MYTVAFIVRGNVSHLFGQRLLSVRDYLVTVKLQAVRRTAVLRGKKFFLDITAQFIACDVC